VPAQGTAILFARSIAAVLPADLPDAVSLAVLDVCGAPAATARVVERTGARSVVVLGAAGKSGCLSLAAARAAGATDLTGLVRNDAEAAALSATGLADRVVVADATDPLAVAAAVAEPADLTVVCVDVPGAEHGAILATAEGGTVVFFSMATSFPAAALGAEGMAADVTMLVGNGYTPGHAELALGLYRSTPGVRALIDPRVTE
jgi:L-erythro-3,5-diaminohexanoate dehydrogenase